MDFLLLLLVDPRSVVSLLKSSIFFPRNATNHESISAEPILTNWSQIVTPSRSQIVTTAGFDDLGIGVFSKKIERSFNLF